MPIARPSYASRRLRRVLSAWVSEVTGLSDTGTQGADVRVLWAEQNLPRPGFPFISLREISSTSESTQQRILADIPATLEVTITGVTGSASMSLNYGDYRYVVQGGDTISDVRDGLIERLLDGPDALVTSAIAADSFELTGQPGALVWPFEGLESVSIAGVSPRAVSVLETSRASTIRVEIFGANQPNDRALDYGDALIADLSRAQTAANFANRGVSIVGPKPTLNDISAISGGERETRAFFDVQISQWTRHIAEDPIAISAVSAPVIDLRRRGVA